MPLRSGRALARQLPRAKARVKAGLGQNAVHALSRAEWRAWLLAHHGQSGGVWLISFKKASGQPRFDCDEAVEKSLCLGWIYSKPGKLDALRSMLWFAPRKARTGWSKPNKQRVERLIAAGLMRPVGLAKVEQARVDGSWNSLDAIEALEIPADLATALHAAPSAEENFMAFPRSVQRGILEWIHTAKWPQTRTARVNETARAAHRNERANQWKGRSPA